MGETEYKAKGDANWKTIYVPGCILHRCKNKGVNLLFSQGFLWRCNCDMGVLSGRRLAVEKHHFL